MAALRRSRIRSHSIGSGLGAKPPLSRVVSMGHIPHLDRRDFLSIRDLRAEDLEQCLQLAARLKQQRALGRRAPTSNALAGQHIALLFEKPSLRTRSTFQIAINELGGHAIEPQPAVTFGSREARADVARNLERWVSGAVIRTFAQEGLAEFAEAAPRLRVINALTDEEHPCQAIADFLTLQSQWGTLPGHTLAFVGDGNNVATSLVQAGALLGVNVNVASPEGYELAEAVVDAARGVARFDAEITLFRNPEEAVRSAHAVYTDAWASMGQESETEARRAIFAPYRVDAALMTKAQPGAFFMHCLPAHRGEEVTADVLDSEASLVFDQAENRLHTQKALLLMLFSGPTGAA